MSSSDQSTQVLTGIGLVLVGLLAGILVMLVVNDDPDGPSVTRIIQRVESDAGSTRAISGSRTTGADVPQPAVLNSLFADVARSVTPGVVSIYVASEEGSGDVSEQLPFQPPAQNLGSGVLISPDGYIVTNNHVVEDAERIQVRLADKRQFSARIVGRDPTTDLAVIRIEGEGDFPVVPFGNSDRVQVGDWVVAVGNPLQLTSTVTAGIVSALGRQLRIIEREFGIENFIQTDAAINPGNSGGALVNLEGELVGINTAIASRSRRSEGYGFAIPSALVQRVATDLISYGEVRRGYLGVSILPVDAQVADELGLDEIQGVYLDEVQSGSAADQAGLQSGDVVVSVMNQPVNAPNDLQSVIAMRRPGDTVRVSIWRDGEVQTLPVELMGRDTPVYQEWMSELRSDPSPDIEPPEDRRPDADDTSVTEIDGWDVGLRPLADVEATAFGIEDGAYVAYVESGGRADTAGLPRDVVITHLNETPIEAPADVVQYLAEATRPILIQVQRRDGTPAFYEIP